MRLIFLYLCLLSSSVSAARKIQVFRKTPLRFENQDLYGGGFIDKSVIIEDLPFQQRVKACLSGKIRTDLVFIDERSSVDKGSVLENNVWIFKDSFVGKGNTIGARSILWPNTYLADQVEIGSDVSIGFHIEVGVNSRIGSKSRVIGCENGKTILGSNVTLFQNVNVGPDVWIGDESQLSEFVFLREGCRLGCGVILGSYCGVGARSQLCARVQVRRGLELGADSLVKEHVIMDCLSLDPQISAQSSLKDRIRKLRKRLNALTSPRR